MQIVSKRIIIRDHVQKDINLYHRLFSDERSMYFLQDIKTETISDSQKSLDIAIAETKKIDDRVNYFWGIFLKDGTYIGEIGYTVISFDNNKKNVHLGYFIHSDYWNKGYVSEAVEAVIDFAFNKNNVIKIETGCLTDNLYSEKIMLKNKFVLESYKRKHQWIKDRWYDRVEYGLLNPQYK